MDWTKFGITKPYYSDDAVCIVHADCRDVLPLLSKESIDLVLTSPPYNTGGDFHTMVRGRRVTYGSYPSFNDALSEIDYERLILDVLAELHRCLIPFGSVMVNMKNRIKDICLRSY